MKLNAEQLDRLLGDCKTPEDVDCLHSQLLQRVINRSLEGEMEVHLEDAYCLARQGKPLRFRVRRFPEGASLIQTIFWFFWILRLRSRL
jgi:hypothetical protein